jgi:hypothetical protein
MNENLRKTNENVEVTNVPVLEESSQKDEAVASDGSSKSADGVELIFVTRAVVFFRLFDLFVVILALATQPFRRAQVALDVRVEHLHAPVVVDECGIDSERVPGHEEVVKGLHVQPVFRAGSFVTLGLLGQDARHADAMDEHCFQ